MYTKFSFLFSISTFNFSANLCWDGVQCTRQRPQACSHISAATILMTKHVRTGMLKSGTLKEASEKTTTLQKRLVDTDDF